MKSINSVFPQSAADSFSFSHSSGVYALFLLVYAIIYGIQRECVGTFRNSFGRALPQVMELLPL